MRNILLLVVMVLLSGPAFGSAHSQFPGLPAPAAGPEFIPGQVLFQVGPGMSARETAQRVSGTLLESVGDGSIFLLAVDRGKVPEVLRTLRGMRGVRFAEPNWLRQLHAPNDPGFARKWDLHNDGSLADGSDTATAGADTRWLEAYNLLGGGFGGSAIIAVIDTGIDGGHPDLDGKIIPGVDYLDNDLDPTDTYGHGTHVAGIALAETDNGTGTVGMAYGSAIAVLPLRVCDSSGCPTSAIVNAIYYAADHGANVINLSLGGRFGSSAEEQAIDYAWSKGLIITASSGNDGAGRVSYPAAFPNAIAVGSTNWHDQLAPYSNTGSDLDIVAPGGDMSTYHDPGGIYSTTPTYPVYLTTTYGYSNNYDQLQGTSMAAPQVAGLAALLFAANPSLSNTEVRSIIESTADDLGKPGWDRSFGWGRINAYRALAAATGSGGTTDAPPTVALTAPQNGSTVVGTITISADAADDKGIDSVEFFLDGSSLGTDVDGSDGWTWSWDSTTTSEGAHDLRATATDSAGQTASDTIGITVDNVASAPVTVLSIMPSTLTAGTSGTFTITGSGFAPGAVVSLENGSGPAPSVGSVDFVDSSMLTLPIAAKSGGPPRTRSWDVRVTNPDGSSGVLSGGLIIQP